MKLIRMKCGDAEVDVSAEKKAQIFKYLDSKKGRDLIGAVSDVASRFQLSHLEANKLVLLWMES